jgi:hypothetical protein
MIFNPGYTARLQLSLGRRSMAVTAPSVSEFLLEVSEDAALRKAFREDPAGTLKKFDITAADRETILARDIERVREAVDRELASGEPTPKNMVVVSPVGRYMVVTSPADNN